MVAHDQNEGSLVPVSLWAARFVVLRSFVGWSIDLHKHYCISADVSRLTIDQQFHFATELCMAQTALSLGAIECTIH